MLKSAGGGPLSPDSGLACGVLRRGFNSSERASRAIFCDRTSSCTAGISAVLPESLLLLRGLKQDSRAASMRTLASACGVELLALFSGTSTAQTASASDIATTLCRIDLELKHVAALRCFHLRLSVLHSSRLPFPSALTLDPTRAKLWWLNLTRARGSWCVGIRLSVLDRSEMFGASLGCQTLCSELLLSVRPSAAIASS
eukprot:2789985-Rhodomonas_salina.1